MTNRYQRGIGETIDVMDLLGRIGRKANNKLTDEHTTVMLAQCIVVINELMAAIEATGVEAPRDITTPEEYLQ